MLNSNYTKEKEWQKCLKEAQKGDNEEKNKFVIKNTGLVKSIVRRFSNRGYEIEELFQVGVIGLIKAVERFNTELNYSFSTYAVPLIIGEIKKYIRDDNTIHISRKIKENYIILHTFLNEYYMKNGKEPNYDEISEHTGLSIEEIIISTEALQEIKSLSQSISKTNEDKEIELSEMIDDGKCFEESVTDNLLLEQLLKELNMDEQEFIRMRYYEGKSQQEVGRCLNLNQVAISRLEKRILTKLRKNL